MIAGIFNLLTTKITGFDVNHWGTWAGDKILEYGPIVGYKIYGGILITSPYFGYAFYTTVGLTAGLKVAELCYNYNYFLSKAVDKTPVVSQVSWGITKVRNVFSKDVTDSTQIEYYPLFNNVISKLNLDKISITFDSKPNNMASTNNLISATSTNLMVNSQSAEIQTAVKSFSEQGIQADLSIVEYVPQVETRYEQNFVRDLIVREKFSEEYSQKIEKLTMLRSEMKALADANKKLLALEIAFTPEIFQKQFNQILWYKVIENRRPGGEILYEKYRIEKVTVYPENNNKVYIDLFYDAKTRNFDSSLTDHPFYDTYLNISEAYNASYEFQRRLVERGNSTTEVRARIDFLKKKTTPNEIFSSKEAFIEQHPDWGFLLFPGHALLQSELNPTRCVADNIAVTYDFIYPVAQGFFALPKLQPIDVKVSVALGTNSFNFCTKIIDETTPNVLIRSIPLFDVLFNVKIVQKNLLHENTRQLVSKLEEEFFSNPRVIETRDKGCDPFVFSEITDLQRAEVLPFLDSNSTTTFNEISENNTMELMLLPSQIISPMNLPPNTREMSVQTENIEVSTELEEAGISRIDFVSPLALGSLTLGGALTQLVAVLNGTPLLENLDTINLLTTLYNSADLPLPEVLRSMQPITEVVQNNVSSETAATTMNTSSISNVTISLTETFSNYIPSLKSVAIGVGIVGVTISAVYLWKNGFGTQATEVTHQSKAVAEAYQILSTLKK